MSTVSQDVLSNVISNFMSSDDLYQRRNVSSEFYQAYLDFTKDHPQTMLETTIVFDDVEQTNQIIDLMYNQQDFYYNVEDFVRETDTLNNMMRIAMEHGSKNIIQDLVERYGIQEFINNYSMENPPQYLDDINQYLAEKIHQANIKHNRNLPIFPTAEILNILLRGEDKSPIINRQMDLALKVLKQDLGDRRTSGSLTSINFDNVKDEYLQEDILLAALSSPQTLDESAVLFLIRSQQVSLEDKIILVEEIPKIYLTERIVDSIDEEWSPTIGYYQTLYQQQFKDPNSRQQLIRILNLYEDVEKLPPSSRNKPKTSSENSVMPFLTQFML